MLVAPNIMNIDAASQSALTLIGSIEHVVESNRNANMQCALKQR